jgi:hypothetical protein
LCGELLGSLADGAAGEGGAPAQPLHALALDPRGQPLAATAGQGVNL